MPTLFSPMMNPFDRWLNAHPLALWLVVHPLWFLGAIVLVLILLSGLFGAIARLTETIWIAILRSPLQLTQWLFGRSTALIKTSLQPTPKNQQERLTFLCDRLEALRQEQDALLQEVRSILSDRSKLP